MIPLHIVNPSKPAPVSAQPVSIAPKTWWQKLIFRKTWAFISGGYFMTNPTGLWFFQRFRKWGVALVGREKELIVRLEVSLRPVQTHSFLHLDLFDPYEARLFILDFKVWRGVSLFFVVNAGVRLTKASREFRAQEAAKVLVDQKRREMAERMKARRVHRGHPWPSRTR